MGFSLTAAAAIIGVAALMALEIMLGVTIPTLTNVQNSYDDMKDRSIDQVQTDINITSVSTPANMSNYDLIAIAKNTGSITLETAYFDILINGTKHSFTCSSAYIFPEDQVYFNVTNLPGTGTRRLKIVTNNGISDYYEYTI